MWTFINDCYHMTKVTIVKNYRNTVTLRQVDLSELVQIIQDQAYEELCRRNKQRIMRAYNGLVLLEVNNLAGSEEADAVRKGAAQIPHRKPMLCARVLPRFPIPYSPLSGPVDGV